MLRRVALILLALALVAGGRLSVSAQAAPQPCAMVMVVGGEDGVTPAAQPDKPAVPCENDTPACAKQGCFLPGVILPAPMPATTPALFGPVRYSPVDFAPRRAHRRARTLPADPRLTRASAPPRRPTARTPSSTSARAA